jgi:hypothetical protein
VAWAAGVEIEDQGNSAGGLVFFEILMLVAAWGLWRAKYWAVLGFQALLAITIVIGALSLVVASNLPAVLLCIAIVVPGSFLFWKLIRAMARIQMPERAGR